MGPTFKPSGIALAWNGVELATALCVAFHCFLRSGEMGNATLGDFVLNAPGTVYNLDLGYTKGGSRRRERESVGIDDPTSISPIRLCKSRGYPADKLLRGGTVEFRRTFHSIVKTFQLENKKLPTVLVSTRGCHGILPSHQQFASYGCKG